MTDIRAALTALRGQPVAFTVYCWLRCQIEANGGTCDDTLRMIASETGLCVATTHKAVSDLERKRLISRSRTGHNNRRIYTLC